MDPPGFALENFDGVGQFRELDGKEPVDAAGEMTTGERFKGAAELATILAATKREQFLRCLAGKLMTYALGRGLEFHDHCTLDRIATRVAERDHRFSALILEVVQSPAFQQRRSNSVQ